MTTREQKMYAALKRIASYSPPERLRKTSESDYGLSPEEALEYAYENVLTEAKNAIRGMRAPKLDQTP